MVAEVAEVIRSGAEEGVPGLLAGLSRLLLVHVTGDDDLRTALRVLALGAELATADDPEDVRALLNLVAAPAGGWESYRRDDTFGVFGLVGASGGGEFFYSASASDPMAAAVSPTVSLGIGFTVPLHLHSSFESFFGLGLQLIDLGSLVTWSNATLEVQDPMSMACMMTPATCSETPGALTDPWRLVSVGLSLRLGVVGPIVLGFGTSWQPRAIHFEQTRRRVRLGSALRFPRTGSRALEREAVMRRLRGGR